MRDSAKKEGLTSELRTLRRRLATAIAQVKRLERARHAEKALRESEERYRRLFEDDLTGDYLATPEGEILDCNPAFVAILGFKNRRQALRTNLRVLHAEEADFAAFVTELRARGKLEHYECVRRRRDGVRIHVIENVVAVTDARKGLRQIRGYLFDNTAGKQAEGDLREAEARYRSLIEFLPDAVVVSDAEERIIFANPAAARLMGAPGSETLVGQSVLDLFHPSHHEAVRVRSQAALTAGVAGAPDRRKFVRLDQSLLDVETAVTPMQFDGQPCVLRVNRDVTARVQAEEALLRKDREISLQLTKIEKLNAALTTLLEHREQESERRLAGVRATLEQLALAYLENLKATPLSGEQRLLVEVMEANLRNIASSFVRQLDSWKMKLTPTEVQIADLLRLGKRTKEIAALLHVSVSAIAFHRNNIRTKLGLKRRPMNLVSYLRAMAQR
ncbi:MAG TPA: PAS domain S-box protein [Candidatus Methylomirabilis sp.]|nr:PAS domain S-box protein [Candidatus Methylomirabilis sp.]